MSIREVDSDKLEEFRNYLIREEKSAATVEKYLRDVRAFFFYMEERNIENNSEITKEVTVAYKKELLNRGYAAASVNSMLASLNSFLEFTGRPDCQVRGVRIQRRAYSSEESELSKEEYLRLLEASKMKRKAQLNLVLQTICGTGIRVSELKYFTVEAAEAGEVSVQCKSKTRTRTILIPGKLRKLLLNYAKKRGIHSGMIFVTRNGKPLNRSNIWAQMKHLCAAARVNPAKVFPHNLRKLFARTFYSIEKDIAKLADLLGHGSIETTRIYIMSTGTEHRRKMERLGLIL